MGSADWIDLPTGDLSAARHQAPDRSAARGGQEDERLRIGK